MANYLRLESGMSYAEAVKILGGSGVEAGRSEVPGYQTVMYKWQGVGLGNMNAMFQNDKLISKAQFGLK